MKFKKFILCLTRRRTSSFTASGSSGAGWRLFRFCSVLNSPGAYCAITPGVFPARNSLAFFCIQAAGVPSVMGTAWIGGRSGSGGGSCTSGLSGWLGSAPSGGLTRLDVGPTCFCLWDIRNTSANNFPF